MNAESSHRSGERVGDFRLAERLGRGAFKVVYAATNLDPQRNGYPARVAVCIPHCQDEEARTLLEIYVFLDMHRHFTPITVRLVRDAIWTVKRQRKSMVFVSPVPTIPEELHSDTTLIFFDLPDMTDMEALIDALAGELGQNVGGELRQRLARAILGLTAREAERWPRPGQRQRRHAAPLRDVLDLDGGASGSGIRGRHGE
jgi:hypothetical protein